jgi:hypothetical protein
MKQKIRDDPEFHAMEADKNPLALWIKIKATSLHGAMSANKAKIREDASKRFNSFTQNGSETTGVPFKIKNGLGKIGFLS